MKNFYVSDAERRKFSASTFFYFSAAFTLCLRS